MRRLPEIRNKAARTRIGVEDYTAGLAFRPVGARYGWATQKIIAWRAYSPTGGSRQVHKVDRGGPHHKFDCYYGSQLHKEHQLPLRCPKQYHH